MLDSDHVILLTLSTKGNVSHRADARQTISAMSSKLFGSYFRVAKLKYGDSASLEAFSPLSPPRCESRSKGFRKCQHDCRQICGYISFIMRVAFSLSSLSSKLFNLYLLPPSSTSTAREPPPLQPPSSSSSLT